MNRATYEAMTREELKEYLKKVDRKNDEAWEVFFEKIDKIEEKYAFPYTEDPQEFERNLTNYLESKKNKLNR